MMESQGSVGFSIAHDEPPPWDATRFTADCRRAVSGPGLRTFLNIADHWEFSGSERRPIL